MLFLQLKHMLRIQLTLRVVCLACAAFRAEFNTSLSPSDTVNWGTTFNDSEATVGEAIKFTKIKAFMTEL